MPGPHHRGYHNHNVHHERNFVNQKEEFGRWDKGCWYPPETQNQPQFQNQPFPNGGPQGPFLVPAFPTPYGMPQGMMPPNGQQGGNNQMQVMPLMMIQGMPPGMGLPPNFDPSTMPMPGMIAKVPGGMPGMPPLPMEGGMAAVPFPLPPNALPQNALPQPGNYIAGTFTEDQILNQTKLAAEAEQQKTDYFNASPQQELLPEALRGLSISPSQSELSCNSTSAYQSEESPAGSDSDNMSAAVDSSGLSAATSPVDCAADAEEQEAEYAEGENSQYQPVQHERVQRPFSKKPHADQGYGNRNGMRNNNASRRGGYQGAGPRGPARPRMAPSSYPSRGSPRAAPKAEEGEWQTVERSGPKHRTGPRPVPRVAR